MRVLFSSTRGTGHLQPLLPYANALVAKGHQVLVAGPQALSEPLLGAGLEHAPFGHPGDAGLAPLWAQFPTIPAEQQAAFALREIFAGANARAALPGLLETIRAWQPQLIVRESAEFAALVAAVASGVPHVRVNVHHGQLEEKACAVVASAIDGLREAAGLTADDGASLRDEKAFTAFPASFDGLGSRGLIAPHRIRPGTMTSAPVSAAWQPETDGLPLVYITLGTVANALPEALVLYRTAVAAVAQLPVRALLTTGRGFDVNQLGELPANLRVAEWVPQAAVFPHTALLVCHGGSGTVLGGLAAGIPQVVLPIGADQPLNAASVAAIGAGIALTKPDTATLSAAIQRVLDDGAFRSAARTVAAEMAAHPDAEHAIDVMLALAAR